MAFETRQTNEETRRVGRFRVSLAYPLLLVLLVLGATWKLTLADRIIARGDLLLYFYPLRDYASQAIREGRLPLWNPYTFMGAPFLANSQVGFFYPCNVLTAWLPVERAVSWNIALHLAIAALGAYALARLGFALGRPASFACGLAFGLGGYLGAQVEHLNQLQVLAWLPLGALLVIRVGAAERGNGRFVKGVAGLAPVIGLQMLAGHTQSLYISLVTLGLIALAQSTAALQRTRPPDVPQIARAAMPLLIVVTATGTAALMCGGQLLPTLELSRESARAGGLPFNEAASFSWRPWVIARALMPTYGDPLFPEYVVYFGGVGLALLALGILHGRRASPVEGAWFIAFVFTTAGFILALGVATPLFKVLYRLMPGFNLFRAQARWLIVFALGGSLLIGLGVQHLQGGLSAAQARRWFIAWCAMLGLLTAGLFVGARLSPEPEYRSLPARGVLTGWVAATAGATALIAGAWVLTRSAPRRQSLVAGLFIFAFAVELLIASQFQPYSRAADRQALTSLRPATAHLLADALLSLERGEGGVGGRVLALSSLFFDPGDKVEQEMIFGPQLSADELYDRLIATKHKEILSPNLSLYYRLPGVDGYDGGLLPTRRYAEFVKQFAATPSGTVDGRLREFLKGVPASRWLEQMAVRYVIADKTGDLFVDGVYYDLMFSHPLTESYAIALEPFESTAIGLVFSAGDSNTAWPLVRLLLTEVTFADGSREAGEIVVRLSEGQAYAPVRINLPNRGAPAALRLEGLRADAGLVLRGLTLIHDEINAFLPRPVVGEHEMRLIHSGDVKIYENVRPAPRAFVEGAAELALELEQISPEHLRIRLPSPPQQPATLILRDACYPGWVARVEGVEVPIECTDILFRAVALPADAREVTFSYEPQSVWMGALLSAIGITLWLLLCGVALLRERTCN